MGRTSPSRTGGRLAALTVFAVVIGLVLPAAPALAAVGKPHRLAPSSTSVHGNPLLRWASARHAQRYQVQIADNSGFNSPVYDVTTDELRATPPQELPTGKLFWRVRGIGASSNGGWAVASFTKSPGPGPALQTPAAGATLHFPTNPPIFTWKPLTEVRTYELQIDDASDFIGAADYQTSVNSYALTDPQSAGKYYWRVRGVADNSVVTKWSAHRSYRVVSIPAPSLTYPIGGTILTDVVFLWGAVAGASRYVIQVSPNGDWTNNLTLEQSVKSTRFSPSTTLDNGSYFWRVQGVQSDGSAGAWSAPRQFTRAWPDQPTLLAPDDSDFGVTQPTFTWTPVRHASHYQFEISTDSNFSPGGVTHDCVTNHTSLTPMKNDSSAGCTPQAGATEYWRVRGIDGPRSVSGIWSDPRTFSYTPINPTQLSPANGATVTTPTLSWTELAGVGRYHVRIYDKNLSLVNEATTYGTSYTPSSLLDPSQGPFHWTVVSLLSDNNEGVHLIPALAPTFNLAAPVGGATLTLLTPTEGASSHRMPLMSWTPVTGATKYKVSVYDANTLLGTTLGPDYAYPAATFTETTANGFNLLTPRNYAWMVQAYAPDNSLLATSALGHYTISNLSAATGYTVDVCAGDTCTGTPPEACTVSPCAVKDTPTFTFDPVVGADHYIVKIAYDAALTNVAYTFRPIFAEFTPPPSLVDNQAGQSFYWYVRWCKDVDENFCGPETTATHSFVKASAPISLLTPANDKTGASPIANQITFTWKDYLVTNEALTPVVGQEARSYRLQVSTTKDFTHVIDDVTVDQTTYTPYGGTYPEGPLFWRVQAIDDSGNNLTWSPRREVWKKSPKITGLKPANNSHSTGVPHFSWSPQKFAREYNIQVASHADVHFSGSNVVIDANTRHAAFAPTNSLAKGKYAWRVRRLDADGRPGPWSATQFFSITPQPEHLIAPKPGATTHHPLKLVFSWKPVAHAASYVFESSRDKSGTSESVTTVQRRWAPTTRYTHGKWFWRVTALDSAGHVLSRTDWRTLRVG